MNHPWRTLRSLPTEIIWTSDPELLGGHKAAWYPAVDAIAMSPHLTQVERRCSLAHELRDAINEALANPEGSAGPDLAGQLQKLAALRDQGVLTEDEFAAKKADILGRI